MVAINDIMVDPPTGEELVDPMAWFDSPGPLEIEIGCGKGGLLLERARAVPDVRLLGIEWANKYYRYCADRMARWQVTNVRVMRTDAKVLFIRNLPEECVSVLHVYHPDPWPKKRHHKRRLVQPDFAAAAIRALVPNGRWLIQSDHEEYFAAIRDLLDGCPDLLPIDWGKAGVTSGPDWAGTNFEVKYRREGRPIFRLAYSRR